MQDEKWAREKEFIKERLQISGGLHYSKFGHKFRSRYTHALRVLKWTQRLAVECPEVDMDVLELAAIFHDVGYEGSDNDEHADRGAKIFLEYAAENHLDSELTYKVAQAIQMHYQKERLSEPGLPVEIMLLMEADIMDEEGAMRIAWDAMASGMNNPKSFRDALDRTRKYWRDGNPMVTKLARKFWQEKQDLVKEYIRQFTFDMEEG